MKDWPNRVDYWLIRISIGCLILSVVLLVGSLIGILLSN